MSLYCAIDLHADNHMVVVIDEEDRIVFRKRLVNDLAVVLPHLAPFKDDLHAVAVESTFNWYWLVDGLSEAGFRMQLVNPCAVQRGNMTRVGPAQVTENALLLSRSPVPYVLRPSF